MECPSLMRKKEKKRKKNFKKKREENLKKKKSQIKSPCDSVYLFTNSNKSNCSLWRGLGAPPLQAMEPQQEGGGHGGRGSRAGLSGRSTGAADACTYCISMPSFVQSSQAAVLQVLLIY